MPSGSVVEIIINGIDRTSACVFAGCRFELAMNAMPGLFEVLVSDRTQSLSFVSGQEIKLRIDGVTMFGGFITQVGRKFAFPADDTSVIANVDSRLWVLRGVDYNILLDKRVLRNTANYLSQIPSLAGDTTDGEALRLMFQSYVDSAGLSTSQIRDVGYLIFTDGPLDSDGIPQAYPDASKKWAWRQQGTKIRDQIAELAEVNSAVYWIDGDKTVWYLALEDTEMPWGFSDVPNHRAITASSGYQGSTIGFRDLDLVEDGSVIVNDALVWGGKALTSESILFARVQNAADGGTTRTSQTYVQHGDPVPGSPLDTYGRWQRAENHIGQDWYGTLTNVRLRAQHIVSGITGLAGGMDRGLSKPQWNVGLTWYAHEVPMLSGTHFHLRPGRFTNFLFYTFGDNVVQSGQTVRRPLWKTLPVRSVSITFPNLDPDGKGYVEFTGQFGIQSDDPWSFWKYLQDRSRELRDRANASSITVVTDGSTSAPYGSTASLTPVPPADGLRTDFSLQLADGTPVGYISGTLAVFVNGILQQIGTNLLELDPIAGTFRLTVAPAAGSLVVARCYTLAAG